MAEDFIDGKGLVVLSEGRIERFLMLLLTAFFPAFRDTGSPPKFAECSSCGRTFNPTVLVGVV